MPPKKGNMNGKPSPKKRTSLHYSLRVRCLHRDIDDGASTSVTEMSVPRKSPSQNWRDGLKKKNPKKFKDVQQQANRYCQYYRIQCATAEETMKKRNLTSKEREEAEMWLARKQRCNETARNRMNKMNKRKREEHSNGSKPKSVKVRTRKQKDQSKKKGAEYKRQQRAKLTPERKEAILARRREIYAIKRDSAKQRVLEEQEQKLKMMEERLASMEEELNNRRKDITCDNNSLSEPLDLRSNNARQKAVERVRKSLPKKRHALINTTIDLFNKSSPKKRRVLRESIGVDPLSAGVMDAVTNGLMTPKTSQKRRFLSSVLSSLKKHRLQRAASRQFRVSRKLLNKACKQPSGRKKISPTTKRCVQDFYEENSTPLPERKFVSKKTMKPRHIMDITISKLYKKYMKENEDKPVSVGVFYSLRPRQVKKGQEAKYIGCLCEYCENINLKVKALNAIKPGTFKDGYDLVSQTMCPKKEGCKYNDLACIKRTCKDCGCGYIKDALSSVPHDKDVSWTRWEQVTTTCYTQKGTQVVKKRKPVQKHDSFSTFLDEVITETEVFADHLFQKDWQNQAEKELIHKLKADEVLGVYDFAENFKCEHQREVQSAYYAHDSTTLHPAVMYYNCPTCLKSVRESIVLISNDLTHDYHLVNTFQKTVTKHLTQTRGLAISTFYRFSDGCSSQYKSRGPISDISYGKEDYGYTIHHNYSGTRHGKGASDGESGVVKRMAAEAVKCGAATISTPEQFYTFVKEHATREQESDKCCAAFRRSVFFIQHSEVDRNRSDRAIRTVPGTRKLHSIQTMRGGSVQTRNLSCFCDHCIRGLGVSCKNAAYVDSWKMVRLGANTEDSDSDPCEQHDYPASPHPPAAEVSIASDEDDLSTSSPTSPPPTTRDTPEEDICPPSTFPETERLKVNDYAAIVFNAQQTNRASKSIIYMAMVTDVIEEQLKVKFMRRNNAGLYFYTKEPEAIHPSSDIVQKMYEPSIATVGRAFLYQFDQDQMNKLAAKFVLK